jgi:hypothetical protein
MSAMEGQKRTSWRESTVDQMHVTHELIKLPVTCSTCRLYTRDPFVSTSRRWRLVE